MVTSATLESLTPAPRPCATRRVQSLALIAILLVSGLLGGCNLYLPLSEAIPERPIVAFTAKPEERTNQSTARFEFGCSAERCSYVCALDAALPERCASTTEYERLARGPHVLRVIALDPNGLESLPIDHSWTVDIDPPVATFASTPERITTDTSATFNFTCNEENTTAKCSLDGKAPVSCESPYTLENLSDGPHSLDIVCTDEAGNDSRPITHDWEIDATGPTVTFEVRPPELTNSTEAEFLFACDEPPCTYECDLDGINIPNCAPPMRLLGTLDQVTEASALVGDQGAPADGFWRLTTAGQVRVPFLAPAAGTMRIAVQAFADQYGADEVRMNVGIDTEPRQTVDVTATRAAPNVYEVLTEVTQGSHDLTLSFLNPASNPNDPAERRALYIGRVTITGPVNVPTPEDPAQQRLVLLPDGERLFVVRATDPRGNLGPDAVAQWTLDTLAPSVTFRATQPSISTDNTLNVRFSCSEPGCTYECSLNRAPFAACISPFENNNLPEGPQTFEVIATDPAGNRSQPFAQTWTVDTVPPTVTFAQAPEVTTNQTSATFAFQCGEADCTYECALGNAELQPCTSPMTLGNLSDGQYTLRVRATDRAGLQSPVAQHQWRIGTSSATVSITETPLPESFYSTGQFKFTCSTPPCTFQCRVTRDESAPGSFAACTSPSNYDLRQQQPAKYGGYTFEVRATDVFGNVTAPATYNWSIVPPRWIQVASARDTTCGLLEDQTMWCWGTNVKGQYGRGDLVDSLVPASVAPTRKWLQVYTGYDHNCALRDDNTIWCAGWNSVGQLGDGTDADRSSLTQIGQSTSWTDVATGGFHSCAMRSNGTVWCWGLNHGQQTGFPSNDPLSMIRQPTQVGTDTDWINVIGGGIHNCAMKTDNSLWCWGDNRQGSVGTGPGSANETPIPTRVDNTATWSYVGAGPSNVCAVKTDGSLWCWGENDLGQGGIGSTTPSNLYSPTAVGTRTDWVIAENGGKHSCAITSAGDLYCWGNNALGQLGIGTRTSALLPTLVTADIEAQWTLLSLGNDHSCGLLSDGSAWCWGDNAKGQLGDGTTTFKIKPTPVAWPH